MPSAVRSAVIGSCGQRRLGGRRRVRCALALAGRAAQGAGMLRRSGSVVSTLASSRIAETPSTSAWWVLVYIATRPSRSPSTTCASHSGRSHASRWLCSREQRSSSSRTRPGLGSALCRTWCSMSKCSSSHPHQLAGRAERAVRPLEEQRRDLLGGAHLGVHLAGVVAPRPLGLLEELQPAHVHRLGAALGVEERRRRRVDGVDHASPPGVGAILARCADLHKHRPIRLSAGGFRARHRLRDGARMAG